MRCRDKEVSAPRAFSSVPAFPTFAPQVTSLDPIARSVYKVPSGSCRDNVVEEDPFVTTPPDGPPARTLDRLCPYLAALLVALAAGLHLAYLAFGGPLDLAPDEAHYWDWSRHLDWSYYSKGPLVAWLIRASCDLFGAWSEAHTGSLAFAVRLPAVLCGSLLLVSLYRLCVEVLGQPRLGLALVAAAL